MKKIWISLVAMAFVASASYADNKKEVDRVENSGTVITEILNIPDNIPQDLLDKAECVVVLPSVVKFAIGIGGSYGRGVMTCRSGESVLTSKVKLGGDAAAAAGPKGRDASAETDATLRAEILSYSRSRGLFAGISLEGSTLRPDNDANMHLYGKDLPAKDIVLKGVVPAPPCAQQLLATLNKRSPKNKSN